MNDHNSILRRIYAVGLAALLVPLHSCASDKAAVTAKPSGPAGATTTGGATTGSDSTTPKPSDDDDDDSGASKVKKSVDPSDDDDDDDDEAEVDPEAEIAKLLKDCGVTQAQLNDPTTPLFKKTVRSYPKTFNGSFNAFVISGTYEISIKVIIDISATLGEARQKTEFEVTGTPTKAAQTAQEKVSPNRGVMISKIMSVDERSKLTADNKDWEGIFCTITPAKSAIIDKGGFNKKLVFEPALPTAVSPKAVASRYKAEIGAGRTFKTTVKVESSSDPKVPAGKTVEGTVKITPIDPALTLDNGTNKTTVTTDLAFVIENDFGGPKATAELGMSPKTIMYFKDQDLKIIVADTGDPQMGQLVLSDEF